MKVFEYEGESLMKVKVQYPAAKWLCPQKVHTGAKYSCFSLKQVMQHAVPAFLTQLGLHFIEFHLAEPNGAARLPQ